MTRLLKRGWPFGVAQGGPFDFAQGWPVALALLMTITVTAWAQPQRPKVLAFFTAGGETDHYLFAQDAMRRLGANAATQGYSFVATSDWDAMSDAGLKEVRLVIWLNDQPHTAAQRDAFRRYMDGGGAWLGFHISGFSSNAWPWYRNDFLGGGGFVASNWPSLPGRVNVDDPSHPTVKNMPASFVAPINEWYSWSPSPRLNPNIKVLLTLDKSNFPMGVKNMLNGGDIPVAWTNTKYRMLYLNYGHGDRIYTSPILTTMIENPWAGCSARRSNARQRTPMRRRTDDQGLSWRWSVAVRGGNASAS